MIRQLADAHVTPPLTEEEARALDAAYSDLVSQREALELALAKRDEVEPGIVLITIPAYREKGRALYDQFAGALAQAVGSSRAEEILRAVGSSVHAENGQLGAQEQNILVEDKGEMFHIVRGTGPLTDGDHRPALAHITVSGNVRPENLSIYAYLKPLFPARVEAR